MGEWRRIGDLFDFEKGALQSTKCTPGEYTFITAAEEWKTHTEYTHDCEALIFAMGASGSLGRTHYFKGKFISSDLCFILQPKKNLKLDLTFYYYIFNFLRSEIVKRTAKGTSKLAINQENFRNYRLPYFDYDHQLIFREKLKNVAGITDNFYSETSNQLDFLKQLRQAVLQGAVEGELTADWRKKHPVVKGDPQYDAAALLAQIKSEKERLVKAGKLRKEKKLPPVTKSDEPFDLPAGWVWCMLGEVAGSLCYGTSQKCDYDSKRAAKVLRIPNISSGIIDVEDLKYADLSVDELDWLALKDKDILVIRSNGSKELVGRMVIASSEHKGYAYAGYLIRIRFTEISTLPMYVHKTSSSSLVRDQIEIPLRTTVGINNINSVEISSLRFPLPPLAEQQAIIAHVDSVMAMISELEKQVAERKEQAQMLMQAVLREAFSGGQGEEDVAAMHETCPSPEVSKKPRTRQALSLREPADKSRWASSSRASTELPLAAETPSIYAGGIPGRILAAMQPDRAYNRADLLAVTGISEADWNWAIRQLKDQGRVVQQGEKRGARYLK